MTETSREAIYHKDNEPYRVVSKANGGWVAQVKGQNEGSKVTDPWLDLHAPTTKAQAIQIMYERKPAKARP